MGDSFGAEYCNPEPGPLAATQPYPHTALGLRWLPAAPCQPSMCCIQCRWAALNSDCVGLGSCRVRETARADPTLSLQSHLVVFLTSLVLFSGCFSTTKVTWIQLGRGGNSSGIGKERSHQRRLTVNQPADTQGCSGVPKAPARAALLPSQMQRPRDLCASCPARPLRGAALFWECISGICFGKEELQARRSCKLGGVTLFASSVCTQC